LKTSEFQKGIFITECGTNATGKKIALDDTILTTDVLATAGSKMLHNFVPPFTATAVARLQDAGYVVEGKTNVGEFGIDFIGETSHFGAVTLPGSDALCGGAGAAVTEELVSAVLCPDSNGYPRRSAAFSGSFFIKPTYGLVSRFGVISTVASSEQIGVMSANAKDAAEILSVIAGMDENDGTSLQTEKVQFSAEPSVQGLKIGVLKNLVDEADDATKAAIASFLALQKDGGAQIEELVFPELSMANTAYQTLSAAEICNNLSRFDGIKFGHRTETFRNHDDICINSRSEAFGTHAKQVILLGSHVLSKKMYDKTYYKAMILRRKYKMMLSELFAKYDVLVLPVAAKSSYTTESILNSSSTQNECRFTSLSSLTGFPSAAIATKEPCSKTPVGVQVLANDLQENILFSIAAYTQKQLQGGAK